MQDLEPFYDKKIKCDYCGESFTSRRVRSRFSIPYQVDSDLCPHFRDGNYNPHFYFVNVCPSCGFASSEEFSNVFPSGTKDIIYNKVTKHWKKRDYSQERDIDQALESYKLAILVGSLKRERNAVLAGLCLRLAWLYRSENNDDQEKRFLGLALDAYDKSYTHSDFAGTSMSELQVLYLIGELSRRLGDYRKAISYFSTVIQHKDAKDNQKIVNRAREQWQLAKEENSLLNKQVTANDKIK